ncbi:MAG: hypothetical protein M1813_002825 [Trichoglossum hirsutum]|nr:MAG: hypothetical protein M1813_002825 [Trichoglossum hirsutum]
MATASGYTEFLQTPLDIFEAEYHNSWNSPDTNAPWSSERTLFEDGKLNYGAGIMSSSIMRAYTGTMMDGQSPYPIPMIGSSPSMCSDDITDPCPSSTDSELSPRGSVADFQLEPRQYNPDYLQRCSPPREYPLRQDEFLLHSNWTGAANFTGAHIQGIQGVQGIVCPKEVQIHTYADEEEGDVAYDEPNQMDCGPEHSYGQEPSDTIVLEPQRGRYMGDGCDMSAKGGVSSPFDEEDDDDDACSSYSSTRVGGNRQETAQTKKLDRAKKNRNGRRDPKSPRIGKVTKQRKEEWRCPQHAKHTFKNHSDYRKHMHTQHTRPFLCTFYFAECLQHFGSKNEWKRHVHSQHLQLGYWECDYPTCADRNTSNSFNRKDLFTQHLRRMHLPKATPQQSGGSPMNRTAAQTAASEQQLPEIWKRCYKVRREAPMSSTCGYCGKRFQGPGSWDDRMEHVGHHYENSREPVNPSDWKEDKELVQWMLHEGLIRLKDEDSTTNMEQGEAPRSRYTVFGVGSKSSRRRSDDEFSDGDRKKLGHRAVSSFLPPHHHPTTGSTTTTSYPSSHGMSIVDVDATSDMDAEAEEEE